MKFVAALLLLTLAIMATADAQIQVLPRLPRSVFPPRERPFGLLRPQRERPFGPTFPRPPSKPFGPTFPRPPNKPFGPGIPPRFRRSISNDGGISVNVDLDRGKPSWNVGAQQKIYENKHGSIHVNAGVGSHRGGKPQGQIGIGGGFTWS